jgi:iron complex transport system substrate-binding protein
LKECFPREAAKARRRSRDVEAISAAVVDNAYRLHVAAGPGLLEVVYEVALARMLADEGLDVRRQVPIPIQLLGMRFDEGFRADLMIEDCFLVELKSVENLAPVHGKQTLTYLRLLGSVLRAFA